MKQKRMILLNMAIFCMVLVSFAAVGFSQNYPNKPIRWIMVTGPGGGLDIISRTIQPKLSAGLGQPLVIDNRPGAGTTLGIDLTAKAPPDGYTMVTASQSLTINVSLYKNLPYDTETDLAPVTMMTTSPYVMVLHPSVPAKSLKEFIDLAKANPGKFNYSTTGNGTSSHIMGELFNIMSGVKTVNIPYKGGPPAYLAVVTGEVNFGFQAILSAQPMIKAGKLKAIAVASGKRLSLMPHVPTLSEAGLPGYDVSPWYGILVRAKTPKPIISRLHSELVKVLRMPEITESLSSEGVEIVGNTPEEFSAVIKEEIAKWAKIVKQANIKIE